MAKSYSFKGVAQGQELGKQHDKSAAAKTTDAPPTHTTFLPSVPADPDTATFP